MMVGGVSLWHAVHRGKTPEPPPLASHGPEDSPTIHIPGVWHFYFPRWMYTADEEEEGNADFSASATRRDGGAGKAEGLKDATSSGAKGKNRRLKKKEATVSETSQQTPKGETAGEGVRHAYTRDPDGICGRKGDYDGPEAIYFFEDHTALIPSLSARGNWALIDPPQNAPLLNKEFRLCIFSNRSPHERLLLRGVLAFSPRPTISLWDERVQLHAAQLAGSIFVRQDAKELSSASATGLPPNVEVWDNAGSVVLGQEAQEASTERKEADAFGSDVQFLPAGNFTAYRLLGEDENYFKVHHPFIRTGPKRLYHVLEPDARAAPPGATATVETLLASKSPVALYPSAAPMPHDGKRQPKKVIHPGRKRQEKGSDNESEDDEHEMRQRLEALLNQFAQEPPEEVLWPIPRLPDRSALEEDEDEDDD
ncbi:conserved hypothetical protein [Neospora caninum Liverpool]|uniref:Uncharacterized protein n=1 Tax=Neospora caninum (strain Liverpool) TaxID=572307 RepID=F0VRT7_NEOCL|nr:conserved hypothetical protein [Neospora caninum Liverpool]CBZ56435.1 conserved hypothetical protein [Neospora caninum Liverpool]|eukprot:XP_003886460.1 conserved hypothetical protein [Neospora caninum Liverpool]